jgi:hypothetical protein
LDFASKLIEWVSGELLASQISKRILM